MTLCSPVDRCIASPEFADAGGSINDVPTNATAYVHCDSLYWMQSYAVTAGRVSQTTIDFLDGINHIIRMSVPGVGSGAYAGYVDPLLPEGQQAYCTITEVFTVPHKI